MCMMNINKCSYGTGDFPTSHFTAEEHCAAAGARLCTSEELQNDESHGSGCNYDFQWWVNKYVYETSYIKIRVLFGYNTISMMPI